MRRTPRTTARDRLIKKAVTNAAAGVMLLGMFAAPGTYLGRVAGAQSKGDAQPNASDLKNLKQHFCKSIHLTEASSDPMIAHLRTFFAKARKSGEVQH